MSHIIELTKQVIEPTKNVRVIRICWRLEEEAGDVCNEESADV